MAVTDHAAKDMGPPERRSNPRPRRGAAWLAAAVIALLAAIAYGRVGECGFVNLDDDAYVEHQPLVNQGFRSASIAWAFLGSHSSNWHPLTTLSHMLDCALFGVRAGPMHWENLLWHGLNSMLVFCAWRTLTGAFWRAAILGALFAVHPLHVESVAWISERKDLLSGFFWLLGLLVYASYARSPNWRRYVLVTLALVGALLSKPMAVTFPCTLLLLDYWPLRRWPERSWRQLFIEKLPLFALVIVHSILTYLVQSAAGAANYGERFSLGARATNAVVSYVRYLGKTFWPETLAPLYHHPGYWPALIVVGATLVLLALTILAWRLRRTQPSLLFGWLWFLGTLVPVIGLVQVGAQSMADRYMYLPILGIFVALLWAFPTSLFSTVRRRTAAALLVAGMVAPLVGITARQVLVWRNSIALYEHSIAAGEDNAGIRYLLAVSLMAAGRPAPEVAAQFNTALQRDPAYTNAYTQLAVIALSHNRFAEARALLEESARRDPKNPGVYTNLAAFWLRVNEPQEAHLLLQRALQLDPRNVAAHRELARLLARQGKLAEARPHFEAAARGERWNPDTLNEYGATLANLGLYDEARRTLQRALWIKPDFPLARANLEVVETASRGAPAGVR